MCAELAFYLIAEVRPRTDCGLASIGRSMFAVQYLTAALGPKGTSQTLHLGGNVPRCPLELRTGVIYGQTQEHRSALRFADTNKKGPHVGAP